MPTLREQVEAGTLTMVWRTAQDNRVCDDCGGRHGVGGKTIDEWSVQGLPGSGWSVCGGNCRCELIPEGVLGLRDPSDAFEPIDFGEIAREVPDVDAMDDKLRIAANIRRIRQLGLVEGSEVIYTGTRFAGFSGLRGRVENLSRDSLVVRFVTPVSPLPEFQAVTVFDFTEVAAGG